MKYAPFFFATFLFSLAPSFAAAEDWIPGWRAGPTVQLGFPHPLTLSLDARSKSSDLSWAAGAGYFGITVPVGADKTEVSLSIANLEGRLRWHPFHGAFFLGAALGRQWLQGSTLENIQLDPSTAVPTRINVKLNSLFLTPHLGWLWSFDSGFVIGFEVGTQRGFASRSDLEVTLIDPAQNAYLNAIKQTAIYQRLEDRVEEGIDKLGKAKLPYISLLRLGWFF